MAELNPEDEELNRRLKEHFESMKQHFACAAELRDAFTKSRDAVLAEARRSYPHAELLNIGPDMDRSSDWWDCVIRVDTDARKDALLRDAVFIGRLKEAAARGGFPPNAMEIESDETINRDFKGSWFFRLR